MIFVIIVFCRDISFCDEGFRIFFEVGLIRFIFIVLVYENFFGNVRDFILMFWVFFFICNFLVKLNIILLLVELLLKFVFMFCLMLVV